MPNMNYTVAIICIIYISGSFISLGLNYVIMIVYIETALCISFSWFHIELVWETFLHFIQLIKQHRVSNYVSGWAYIIEIVNML